MNSLDGLNKTNISEQLNERALVMFSSKLLLFSKQRKQGITPRAEIMRIYLVRSMSFSAESTSTKQKVSFEDARQLAMLFFTYPRSVIADSTRFLVFSFTECGALITRDTVISATPALFATYWSVILFVFFLIATIPKSKSLRFYPLSGQQGESVVSSPHS